MEHQDVLSIAMRYANTLLATMDSTVSGAVDLTCLQMTAIWHMPHLSSISMQGGSIHEKKNATRADHQGN